MIYLEYHDCLEKYKEVQRKYDEILTEKEQLFQRTQPSAIRTDKEKVQGGKLASNSFDSYLIRKEETQIEERLAEVKSLLTDRERLLKFKLGELRRSQDLEDKVYLMRYVERVRVYKIATRLSYHESHIYRILNKIDESLKHENK